ncbi:MAG: RNA-directed DNA polymerase [Clostridia bacterium]|nr:RNA-directed DNA polymerase [Clostridia bacterium]
MREHFKLYGATGYFVKLDIRKYFPSINHSNLLQKISKLPIDKRTYDLIVKIVTSYGDGVGLPMGNQSSQCFALFYLDVVDRFIKEQLRVKYYVRYMDDMILLLPDKKTAQQCFTLATEQIEKNLLLVNKKSQIVALKNGIEFLGWRFRLSKTGKVCQTIRHSSAKRIYEKAKLKSWQLRRVKKANEKVREVLACYNGHLNKGNSHNFYNKVVHLFKYKAKR